MYYTATFNRFSKRKNGMSGFLLLVLLAACPFLVNAQSPTAPALNFNTFIHEDAELGYSESEGPTAVGRDLYLQNQGHSFAIHSGGTFQVDGMLISLLVGRKVVYQSGNSNNVKSGYVKIGQQNGSTAWYMDEGGYGYPPMRITPSTSYNGNPRLELLDIKANEFSPYLSASNKPPFQSGLIDFDAAFTQLKTNSTSLSTCSDNAYITQSNGTVIPGRTGLPNQVKITLNNGINILNISGAEMNNLSELSFNNTPSATQVLVVNVNAPGSFAWNVYNSAGSFGGLTGCKYILYNFYNTTSLTVQGNGAVEGTILAPFAALTKVNNNSNIEGQVIAKSFKQNAGGEIHYAVFQPNLSGCGVPVPPTVPSFTINSNAQCKAGNSFVFTNSSTGGTPLSYAWTFGDGGTSTSTSPTYTYASSGTYTVKLVVTGAGGKDSVSETVNVWAMPVSGFTVNNANQVITGNNFVFTTTNHVSGHTYQWSFGDGNTSSTQNPSHSYAATGTYSVRQIITSNKGCKDTTTQVVTVTADSTDASFTINNNGQCKAGNSFVFTNSSTGGAPLSYAWTFGDGGTSTSTSPTYTYASSGTYTVKLVVTGAGGKDSVSKTVNVWAMPVSGFTVNSASQVITGNNFVFTTTNHVSGHTYQWSFGDGNTSADQNPSHSYAATGTYTVKQIISSNKGCTDTSTQVVTVTADPTTVSFSINNNAQCLSGNSFVFTSNATGSSLSYAWSFGDGGTSADEHPAHTYTTSGDYTVKLVVTGAGGVDSSEADLTVYVSPVSGFTVNAETQELTGNSFKFTTTTPGITHTYTWSFGDNTTSADENPVKSYDSAGLYHVAQIITSVSGCSDTFWKNVVVICDSVSSGNEGGIESESLGGLVSQRDFNRIRNSVNSRVNYTTLPLFAAVTAPHAVSKRTKDGQELADMIPQQLQEGDAVYVTSPTDLLSITAAVDVLSVDYTRNQKAKAVVLGIKTLDKAYSHTKSICDRFRGSELLFVDTVKIQGFDFTRFAMKRDGGIVEYALAFVIGKDTRRASYTLQTNWLISEFAADDNVYNFQVWSANPDDAVKLTSDVLDNLKREQTIEQINQVKLPQAYITYGMRDKANLVVRINNTIEATTGRIVLEERANEDGDVKLLEFPVSLVTGKENVFNLPIKDGYEYQGRVYVNDILEDEVYMADGNWGIDYDANNTTVHQFTRGNNPERVYYDKEYPLYRNVTLKANNKSYLSVYKAIRSGTEKADLTAYRSVKFFAKGTGRVEVRLTRDSIVDWKSQYKTEITLDENGKEYAISFDDFYSDRIDAAFTPSDIKTIVFTFTSGNGKQEQVDFHISQVSFSAEQILSKRGLDSRTMEVAPTPSNGKFECFFNSEAERTLDFTITDVTGKLVYSRKIDAVIGVNSVAVDLNLASGTVLMISLKGKDLFYDAKKQIIK